MKNPSTVEFGGRRVPMILQTETAECGIACLAMIGGWHGHRTDLAALRSRFHISIKGVNLNHIMQYAHRLDLSSRALRVDIDELSQLALPCILHWDLSHFVVLVAVRHHEVVIHDPAKGICHVHFNEVTKNFTGVALELSPVPGFKPINDQRRISLTALMGKVDGLWRTFALIFGMALALEVLGLMGPIVNQWVVDEVLVSADRSLMNVLIFGCALLLLIQTAISLARGWSVMYLSTHLNLQWATNVFTHLLHLPVCWFEKRHLGDIVSRFGSISSIQNTLTTGFIEAILDGLFAITTLLVMLFYSFEMTCTVVLGVLIYACIRAASFRPIRSANEEAIVLSAKEHSYFLEAIRGIQAIKLFGRELDRRGCWVNLLIDSLNRDIRTEKFMLYFSVVNTAVFGTQHLLILWLGATKVMQGSITIGMLFAFMSYSSQFTMRISALINKFIEFRLLSVHAERLSDIVLEPAERQCGQNHIVKNLTPRIELLNVSFRYSENEPWVLRNLTVAIEPGESVAIVGPSGCGKTTLVKLILGILEPTEGELRLGGCAARTLGSAAIREVVAAVMQDDHLLAGSLEENISFFDYRPDRERIQACAILAAIHDDIMSMPMGYYTLAGDMGTTLSGGQKQRILLARALYKSPKILVLDEATSHLDIWREREVSQAICSLNFTRIIVAHRPETIAMSGRIIQLTEGQVACQQVSPA